MTRRWLAVVLVVLLVLPGPALAFVQGEPRLRVGLDDDTVHAGEETTLPVTVANGADLKFASQSNPALNAEVTTARAVEVTLEDGGPVRVETGTRLLGSLPDGASATLPFAVSVRDDARPGVYEVPVELRYAYTASISDSGAADRRTETVTRTLRVRVEESARFQVLGVESAVHPGAAGRVSVLLENVGSATARDAQFSLSSPDPALSMGATGAATRYDARWAPGETRWLNYTVVAAADARAQPYTLELAPSYRDATGATVTQRSLLVGITPSTGGLLSVADVRSSVVAGGAGAVTVALRNDGDQTLRDASVRLSSSGGLAVDGGPAAERFVGRWAPGETRTFTYDLAAGEGAGGSYPLAAAVTYTDGEGATLTSRPTTIAVTVPARSDFAVVSVGTDATAPGSGTVTLTLRNDAGRTVSDASVSLATTASGLAVDGGPTAERFVGRWAPGETRTLTYDLAAGAATTGGTYTLTTGATYTLDGASVTTRPVPVGVSLTEPLAFGLADLGGDLYVGERGTVRGTVVNEGDRTARDAVVLVEPRSPGVSVPGGAVSLGDLGPGESATFDLETDVAPTATAGSRPFALTVEYGTDDGTRLTSDPLTFRRSVAPDREPLAVEPVNATFAPDSSGALVVRVTNTGDTAREEVRLQITPGPPFTSVAPSAYVERLAPGETAEVAFELSVDEDAVPSSHAVALNVSSEPADGGRAAVDSYQLPVTVAPESAGPVDTPSAIAAVLLGIAVVAGAAYWWFRVR
ncbi:COG1361 S-layer family protein [Haloglomus litoreum]|uniref:COG1361 S-layer family protein n=1 Tax=Haloglomus litoreum TaxID=3034026 RepID=UPI0023E7B011|nr:NEW3 domain-containing protein [Haloglomus sp. DT116]